MTYSNTIIKHLTALCVEKKIIVDRLGALSGITQSTVDNLLKGKTKNPKLKHFKINYRIEYDRFCISESQDFPEFNETAFEDE